MAKVFRSLPGWGCATFGIWLGFRAEASIYMLIFTVCVISYLLHKLVTVLPMEFNIADVLFNFTDFIFMASSIILSTALPTALCLESNTIWSAAVAIVVTIIGVIVAIFVGSTLNYYLER
jgi:hypothetical protein